MNGNPRNESEHTMRPSAASHIAEFCSEEYTSSIERREQHPPARENYRLPSKPSPNTILITNAEREASLAKESDVILIDAPKDLSDVLGSNWPSSAGAVSSLLNASREPKDTAFSAILRREPTSSSATNNIPSSSASSTLRRNSRNRSSNPLAHIMHSGKTKENRSNVSDMNVKYSDQNPSGESRKCNDGEPFYNNLSSNRSKYDDERRPDFENVHIIEGTNLELGSVINVELGNDKANGVIKWIGKNTKEPYDVLVGVELDEVNHHPPLHCADGTYQGRTYFRCPKGRQAVYVEPEKCSLDMRFVNNDVTPNDQVAEAVKERAEKEFHERHSFGPSDDAIVVGRYPPIQINRAEELQESCGKSRGIQGLYNSCYLDATLFAMFAFTHVFDSILYRPREFKDVKGYEEVQRVLLEEIVNPLRKNLFVRAERVMHLRKLLDRLSSVTGLTTEEKDPEEFLGSLLTQIMRAEPFLKLNSGQDAFFYQLFVEKDDNLKFPTVQRLFEQSFHASDIKLSEVPSCLIIQMPRFGKDFKMYSQIMPSLYLDITNIIDNSPRECGICGGLAEVECKDCFELSQLCRGLEGSTYCGECYNFRHDRRTGTHTHKTRLLNNPPQYLMFRRNQIPSIKMELFAVLCIETSHYVSFVKTGIGPDAPWCFFDSMADRKGEANGYNIPEMVALPELSKWLSNDPGNENFELALSDKSVPDYKKRLFCDAYMCLYQSTDVMMYR